MSTGDEQVGQTVRQLRSAMGLSQAQLAEAMSEAGVMGWHPQTVVRIEQGIRPLRLMEAVTLARVLRVDVSRFYEQPEEARDDDEARRATASLRQVSDAMLHQLHNLRVAETLLEHVSGNALLSPQVAAQVLATLEAVGTDATIRRLVEHARREDPDLLHILDTGQDPTDFEPDPDDDPERFK